MTVYIQKVLVTAHEITRVLVNWNNSPDVTINGVFYYILEKFVILRSVAHWKAFTEVL